MRNFYEEFKTPIVTIVILFLAFFLYTKFAGPIPFYINSVNTTKTDLFSAQGQAEETAVPDTAVVYLGITTQGTSVSDAQNKTNQISKKLLESIKNQGISDKDIKTTNYSVNPNYGTGGAEPLIYPPIGGGNQRITGYTVTQNIEVKVKPIDKVNSIIDGATASGANLVGGVSFTFSDELQKSLEEKARIKAVANAKAKAQSLANASGVRLGRVINVVENSIYPGIYPLRAALEKTTDQDEPTNITPGENSISVSVIIYYETY